jgi:ketosteroid isomerase-like protein
MKMLRGKWLLGAVLLCGPLHGAESPGAANPGAREVDATLNRFHEAASKADGAAYFALFAPEGVFIGTDAAERWTVDQFKAYAMPYFSKGNGWTYVPRMRHVQLSPQGDVAWFDEILDNRAYGTCRGSGVLRRVGDTWLICQYHLTIPIPNGLAAKVVGMIRDGAVAAPTSPR